MCKTEDVAPFSEQRVLELITIVKEKNEAEQAANEAVTTASRAAAVASRARQEAQCALASYLSRYSILR